jgi:glycosyltransferase involved in cell wall biosynthesis
MKICYVCPDLGIPLDGTKGASAHVRGLVRAFGLLGHEVMVVAGTAETDGGLGVPVTVVPRPVTHRALPLKEAPKLVRALGHLWNNIELEHVLKDVFQDFQPDLVYERYSPFGAATGQVSRALGLRHILEVNALLAEEGRKYRDQALGEASAFLETIAFRTPRMLVTVSDALREAVIEHGARAEAVLTVPNGVDTARFFPRGPVAEIGMPGNTVVGFVGSLKPWHGIDRLVRIFQTLADDPDYHLLVVGDGPERKHLKKLAEQHPGRVTLKGNVAHDDVPALVRSIDIAIAPYPALDRFYFSPLKILEYLACGCPVVASSIGQVEDLVKHGQTGLLVPADDDREFVSAIRTLKDDPELRNGMGTRASGLAEAEHDWTNRARDILAYEGGLEGAGAESRKEGSHG